MDGGRATVTRKPQRIYSSEERRHQARTREQQIDRRTEDFIRRNIAGQKTKQLSRRKMLERITGRCSPR
jgi:ATP-binding cassette subfamily F protein 3